MTAATAVEVLGAILFSVFVCFIYYAILIRRDRKKLKKLRKNYDDKEDLSKQGEENRRRLLREGGSDDKGKPSLKKFVRPERRPVLQAAVAAKPRQNSRSRGKTSKSPREVPRRKPRGIFKRLQKR